MRSWSRPPGRLIALRGSYATPSLTTIPGNKLPPPLRGSRDFVGVAYLGLANSRQPQATGRCPFGAGKDFKDYRDMKDACDVLVFGDLDALWLGIFPL